jgi:predicted nucleic acid-binding protein
LARLIVADAGPLIAFGRIEKLALLPKVLGDVLVPDAVVAECLLDAQKPGASAIREALRGGTLIQIDDPAPALSPFPVLDAGESAAIRVALKLSIPVLIDEKAGRKIAISLGLSVVGTVGVLLSAKKYGHIEAVSPLLDAMRAHGYYISDTLTRAALTRAGER